MIFVKTVVVAASVTAASPQREVLKVSRGYLMQHDIRLSAGTDVASTIRIMYHGTQILPRNREESLLVPAIFIRMPDIVPLLEPPYELEIALTNAAGTTNTVTVAVLVVDPELMSLYSGYKTD